MKIKMNCILALIALLFFLALSGGAVFAQDNDSLSEPMVFDIESAIEYAFEHNPGYRRTALALEIAWSDLDYNFSIFEPILRAGLDVSHTRTGGLSYDSQVIPGSDLKKYEMDLSLSQLFPAGDTLALSFGGNRSDDNSSFIGDGDDLFRSYTSALGLTYSRPLMKGFGAATTMAGVKRAIFDTAISEAAAEVAQAQLTYLVRIAYLRVAAAREALTVAEASLTEAESLYDETKAMVKAGVFAEYQQIAAKAGLFSRREELLRAGGEYEKSLNGLKEILGADFAIEIEISPGLAIPMPEIDTDSAMENALAKRPEVLQLQLQRRRVEVDLAVARNSLKPELGFTGGCGFHGADSHYGGSLGEMDNFSWFAGLIYTIPLGGNRAPKSQFRIAQLAIEDIDLQLQSVEDGIRREVLDAIVEFENARERLTVAGAGLDAALVKIDSEKKRFELGLITAGDLLEYEREFTQAQFNEIDARIAYMGAAALLAKLTHNG